MNEQTGHKVVLDLGQSFGGPVPPIGAPTRLPISAWMKMFLATLTAAKNKPENSTWMDDWRSEWLSSTGEILPESVAEFTKQAVLAGIDPNAFLDDQGFRLEQLDMLLPLIFAGLERRYGQAQKTALVTTPEAGKPRNKRNNSKKHLLVDDENTLCLAAARDFGSSFCSAAAFVRDYRAKRPDCEATQKALEQMLSRECDIWKKSDSA